MKIQKDRVLFFVLIAFLSVLFLRQVVFSDRMLFGTDWLSGAYMQRDFFERSLKTDGELPLWNPYQFAGIPTGEGFFGEIFHPLTLALKYIFPTHVVWTLIFLFHMIVAGFGMYLYLGRRISSKINAAVFSLAYMFTSSMLSEIYGGHDGRFMVVSYLPILLYCIDTALERVSLKWFLLSSVPASLMLLTGHIQSSYYAIVFSLFYVSFNHINNDYRHRFRNYTFAAALLAGFLVSLANKYAGFAFFILSVVFLPIFLDKRVSEKTLKIYSFSAAFVVFAASLSAVQYLPVLRFLPFAARGAERSYQYAVSWSMGLPDILDQIVSGFSGINLNQSNTYWGENPFKLHSTYIGILPFIFALSMIFAPKKKSLPLFFTVSVISVFLLALGGNTPLYRIFYSLFPYVDKFRAPELIFFLASFSVVVLAALFFEEDSSGSIPYISVAAALFGACILLLPQFLTDLFRQMAAQKIDALRGALSASAPNALKTILFSAAAFFAFKLHKGKYKKYVPAVLALLIVGDLWISNSKFVVAVDNPSAYFSKDEIVNELKKDNGRYRVFSFGYRNDDYLTLHGFEIISGNHPSPFADYQKFINNSESVMFNPEKLFMVPNRLKFLNVKYAVVPFIPSDTSGYDQRSKNIISYYSSLYNSLKLTESSRIGNYSLMVPADYMERAFCSDSFMINGNLDSILSVIDNDALCGLEYITLDSDPEVQNDSVKLEYEALFTKYTPNRVELTVKTNKECILTLLDEYYTAWKCNVNGKDSKIFKSCGIFRGVKVDKGENSVVFYYDPKLQVFSAIISILSLLFVALFALFKKT